MPGTALGVTSSVNAPHVALPLRIAYEMPANNVGGHVRRFVLINPTDEHATVFKVHQDAGLYCLTSSNTVEYSFGIGITDPVATGAAAGKAKASLVRFMEVIEKSSCAIDVAASQEPEEIAKKALNRSCCGNGPRVSALRQEVRVDEQRNITRRVDINEIELSLCSTEAEASRNPQVDLPLSDVLSRANDTPSLDVRRLPVGGTLSSAQPMLKHALGIGAATIRAMPIRNGPTRDSLRSDPTRVAIASQVSSSRRQNR